MHSIHATDSMEIIDTETHAFAEVPSAFADISHGPKGAQSASSHRHRHEGGNPFLLALARTL
jgi:hypothetical protein